MLTKLFVSIVLLASVTANAGEISAIQSAGDCTVNNIPSFHPFEPRPVLGEYAVNAKAQKKISAMKNPTKTSVRGNFLKTLTKVESVVSVDAQTDAAYPQDGCTRTATLVETGIVNPETKSAEYALVCKYDYHCVDNR